MRIGTTLSYAGGFTEVVDELAELEKIGLDIAFVAEAYSYDAASQLGYLAAKTSTVKLASGIFQLYTRTPHSVGHDRGRPGLRFGRPVRPRHRRLGPR